MDTEVGILKLTTQILAPKHAGHMTDVGGKVPGSLPTDATQIFEEGVRVPPTKIYKNDELQEELYDEMELLKTKPVNGDYYVEE